MKSLEKTINDNLESLSKLAKIEVLDFIRFIKYKNNEISLSPEEWAEIKKIEAENDWVDADDFWKELANDEIGIENV